MGFTYNSYYDLTQTKLILANPQKNKIGIISGVTSLKIKPFFASISELSFKLYKESNGVVNKFYDQIVIDRLIEAKSFMWFQIKNVEEKHDENSPIPYKEVVCLSLENQLIRKHVYDINGVLSLYDNSTPDKSIMHIVQNACNWNTGTVDSDLLLKYRTFSIDSEKIYNLLTSNVSKSFDCLFDFNTYTKQINARKLSNVGKLTNIVISDKNVLKQYAKESDSDKIVTKMRIRGATNSDGSIFDCRAVIPSGLDYIINVSYYMDWMSQSLIDALNAYNTKTTNYQSQYTNLISTLKTYQSDLLTLQNQLIDLQSQQKSVNGVCQSIKSLLGRVPLVSDLQYTQYQTALSTYNNLGTQINSKNTEITNKNNQINSVKTSLNNISVDLSMGTNFTQSQLDELDNFLKEGEDYVDESFCSTDVMTETEIIEMKLELLANATNELARISRPQYTIQTTINNLFTIQDNKDQKISYKKLREDFQVGNMITLKFRDDYFIQVRLMSMEFDFDNLSDIQVTFSDKSRLDSELIQLAEILANANRSSTTVSYEKIGWNNASSYTSEFKTFKNGMLNLATNALKTNNNQKPLIDEYGIHMFKLLDDGVSYSPYQAQFQNNQLLFTNDGWNSSIGGIGIFEDSNGVKTMSVFASVIAGNLLMSEKLSISNKSGTYLWNDNGMTASAILSGTTYSVGINPSTPYTIFNIKVGGIDKFYIDSISKKLVMKGAIYAESGEISGDLTVTGTLTGGTISGSSITSASITGGTIEGTTISGVIINGASINSLGGECLFTSVTIQGTQTQTTIFGGFLSAESIEEGGVSLSSKYAPISHSHSQYATDSELSSLESRISALESA